MLVISAIVAAAVSGTGRSAGFLSPNAGSEGTEYEDPVAAIRSEVERIFYTYLDVLEAEDCLPRSICEFGLYTKNLKGKALVFGLADYLVPETMKSNMKILKDASLGKVDKTKCRNKYKCTLPKM